MMKSIRDLRYTLFLTPQEHQFMGSTVDREECARFYVPILIQKGYDIQAVNILRQQAGTFLAFGGKFISLKRKLKFMDYISCTLEPLNEAGETIRDPSPLEEGISISPKSVEKLRLRT